MLPCLVSIRVSIMGGAKEPFHTANTSETDTNPGLKSWLQPPCKSLTPHLPLLNVHLTALRSCSFETHKTCLISAVMSVRKVARATGDSKVHLQSKTEVNVIIIIIIITSNGS